MEALRPPEGFRLDYAIGTTYSLDLVALLVAPLAFTVFDWDADEERPGANPIALFHAIRRNADRIAVFCQAGQIKVPPTDQRLFAYLEDCVHEVVAPLGGVFHPKCWVLRYEGGEAGVAYRLLCASRNLTFDRSWDTLLVLDGVLKDRRNAYAKNHPLGEFVAALAKPALTRTPIADAVRERIEQIADEIRRVEFEDPLGLTVEAFWPLGLDPKSGSPFVGCRERFLVVSPFLSAPRLEEFSLRPGTSILVSRVDTLAGVEPEVLRRFSEVLFLEPALDEADGEAESDASNDTESNSKAAAPKGTGAGDVTSLSGLHAKLFIADDGWHARIWTGSANATTDAFARNVEFMVELRGKKSEVGIDAVLGRSGQTSGMASLLRPYEPTDAPANDDWQKKFDLKALEVQLAIANAGLSAAATPGTDAATFALEVCAKDPSKLKLGGTQLDCWPITCGEELFAQRLVVGQRGQVVRFDRLSLEALTPFLAVRARLTLSGRTDETRFVVKAPLTGAPEDRKEQVLRFVIRNQQQFIQYLLMLLASSEGAGGKLDALEGLMGAAETPASDWAAPTIFETLVRAFDRNPEQLDEVSRLLADLRTAAGADSVLPDGFEAIWEPIWTARKSLSHVDVQETS